MYKFNVIGGYGVSNFGDDLLMVVFENFLTREFPDAQLNFEGQNLNYPKKLLKTASYCAKSFNEDWLIYGGGTQFFSFTTKNPQTFVEKFKRVVVNPKLIWNKLERVFSPKNKYHTAILGLGLGPFNNNYDYMNIVKNILKETKFIGLRDEQSQKYCKEWNIDSVLGADVVFSSYFDMPKFPKVSSERKRKKIGVIVRDWEWEESGRAYFNPIVDFVNENEENENCEFIYILYSSKKDKNWLQLIGDKKAVIWDPEKYSVDEFLMSLFDFDAFISARYHGAILGALLGKPTIAIEIEPKLRLLTQQIPEMALWSKPFDLRELNELVSKMDYQVSYSSSIEKLRVASDRMLHEFRDEVPTIN